MSAGDVSRTPFALLRPPYDALTPVSAERVASLPIRGTALVWDLVGGIDRRALAAAAERPRGIALMVMLPPPDRIDSKVPIFEIVESCRPHSILPHHPRHCVDEWTLLLKRLPPDLPAEVVDHLVWRGMRIDLDTRHILRRILELSAELRTVSALARALYVSRRALGRRLLQRGLPVPSHWLHFGRVLRVALKLQASTDNLFSVACSFGYPDGFSLSNQMVRLTGVRPTQARTALGWEWLVEAWMQREQSGTASDQMSVPESPIEGGAEEPSHSSIDRKGAGRPS